MASQVRESRRGQRHVADPVGAQDEEAGDARGGGGTPFPVAEESEQMQDGGAQRETDRAGRPPQPVENHAVGGTNHVKMHRPARIDHRGLRANATMK